ncbi:hypothetical protein PMV_128 [Port-miou virus]|uniref:Uncharacterized protein n=1 Tax=Port-miou virus TaxID=1733873 RepID=A0A0N9Q0U0_9VIRU|nr:hypothetical protein PMV_128 [Port-miou virus]
MQKFLDKKSLLFFSIGCGLEIPFEKFLKKDAYGYVLPDGSYHGEHLKKNKQVSEMVTFHVGKAHGPYILQTGDSILSGNYVNRNREGEFVETRKGKFVKKFVYEDDKLLSLEDTTKTLRLFWNEDRKVCFLSKGSMNWVRTYSVVPNDPSCAFFIGSRNGMFQEPPCFSKERMKLDTHKNGEIYYEFQL